MFENPALKAVLATIIGASVAIACNKRATYQPNPEHTEQSTNGWF